MPSMPVAFWGDDDGSRYRAAYFEDFPGVWRHGDWIEITERGSCIITGRSDATLNRGGVRMGTAEFYSAVEGCVEVDDALVVHLDDPDRDAGRLVLFVQLAPGVELDDGLRSALARTIRASSRLGTSPTSSTRCARPAHDLREEARAPDQAVARGRAARAGGQPRCGRRPVLAGGVRRARSGQGAPAIALRGGSRRSSRGVAALFAGGRGALRAGSRRSSRGVAARSSVAGALPHVGVARCRGVVRRTRPAGAVPRIAPPAGPGPTRRARRVRSAALHPSEPESPPVTAHIDEPTPSTPTRSFSAERARRARRARRAWERRRSSRRSPSSDPTR
jgi:hypothetical protein